MEEQGGSGRVSSDNRALQQTQDQVNEVVGIMRVNVQKVLERDQKLSELDTRADALQHGASQFEQQATKLKRKYWWKNLKMMIIIGVLALVLLILIIWWATPESSGSGDKAIAASSSSSSSSSATASP
ncbi:vesicle-associated membrane protein 3-like [Arctopsyche grandis]|uniref:vesicle-associated membrane protein 3-like n=1 Tax=Arctopsyche grandis TaxID=121162 RepID=UPI00406DA4E6